MVFLDWMVVLLYLLALVCFAWYLGREQSSNENYYLGSGQIPPWALATSVIATQCSTNSLLGAPAFVAFSPGGGMQWLQYEMAVPLAMLALCFLMIQIRKTKPISIYAYLEERLGTESRLLASGSFLFFRGVATGVTVYGVASVLQLITRLSYLEAVLILMMLTIIYDVLGGIKAVVYSDVLQMALLLSAILFAVFMLWSGAFEHADALKERAVVYQDDWGLNGNQYGFWPMLFGGIFLYMAYYGCDQSQAQRILAAKDDHAATRVLLFNGMFRFPLVFLYCLLGLGLAAYALNDANFIESLPKTESGAPNINLAFPGYVLQTFPAGLVGLVMVGLFAAAMSSIDSALNSLSASTLNDFILKFWQVEKKRELLLAKGITLFWGVFAIVFSFQVEAIAPTVLEVINKVGSLMNGPLLYLFIVAVFFKGARASRVILGFLSGFILNLILWLWFPNISWLWWNVAGCLFALVVFQCSTAVRLVAPEDFYSEVSNKTRSLLLASFIFILIFCWFFPTIYTI
jgi:SSS family solute:Na+ symporter